MTASGGPLRILHVTAPTPAGGLERVVEALAVGHHRRGHHVAVAVLVFDDRASSFVTTLAGAGVTVHTIRLTPRAYLRERRAVRAYCRQFRPHVVHTHGPRLDFFDRGVAAGLGIPTVTTVHGPSKIGGLKGALAEWLQRRTYRRFDAVVAVSTALHRETLAGGVRGDRLHRIPNAWGGLRQPVSREAARTELALHPDDRVVGWVGRLIPVKGGDLFLEALRRLPEPRPIAAMIGYGPLADALRRQAAALGLAACVRFYDGVRDAGRLFRAFDTYVLSSRSEGLPIVMLEAMAAGTPIVATQVGGVGDLLSEDEGWLVPPGDSGALAAAIAASLGDRREARERAQRAAHRLASDFALEPWLDRYEAVYRAAAR